jgi:hypothetical protein
LFVLYVEIGIDYVQSEWRFMKKKNENIKKYSFLEWINLHPFISSFYYILVNIILFGINLIQYYLLNKRNDLFMFYSAIYVIASIILGFTFYFSTFIQDIISVIIPTKKGSIQNIFSIKIMSYLYLVFNSSIIVFNLFSIISILK